jgi:hypothetical protein
VAKLRIEFERLGGGRGMLGAQLPVSEQDLVGAVMLTVTGAATAAGSQPVVPASGAQLYGRLVALDAACYVDAGPSPDPTTGSPFLVLPGQPLVVRLKAGDKLSAVLAADAPAPVQTVAVAGGLVKTMKTLTLPAYASGGTVTTVAQDGTSSTATVAANTSVQLLAANGRRRNFRVENIGLNKATYGYGSGVSPSAGWVVSGAGSAGEQGGSDEDQAPHTGAIYGVSASGTTLVLVEG